MSKRWKHYKILRRDLIHVISVGIDVSKAKSTVIVLNHEDEVLAKPFELQHIQPDVQKFIHMLKAFPDVVHATMEATGYYHWPILQNLLDAGIYTVVVNPILTRQFAKASKIRQGKTDKLDCSTIARFGLAHWNDLPCCSSRREIYDELNIYARQYYHYMKLVNKEKLNLGNILDKTMPGITALLKDLNGGRKLSDFADRFIHYQYITAKSEKWFIQSYESWAKRKGYQMNERLAKKIYAMAQNGIPTLPFTQAVTLIVKEAVRALQSLEMSIKTILSHMQELASSLPEYGTVLAMNGVGKVLAPRLIAEIGDIRRFRNRSSLIAYAGIDAPPYQSGSFESKQRSISKRGNKYLRKTGFEVMKCLKVHKPVDDAVYRFICKKEAEGKYYLSAYMAGFNKFLRIYYARVKQLYPDKAA
jgi:transposase